MKEIPDSFLDELAEELASLSGLILWRVTGTWANNGRWGEIDTVVEARTATEAIAIAWEVEDDRDLRTVHVEWLHPIELVMKKGRSACNGGGAGEVTDE